MAVDQRQANRTWKVVNDDGYWNSQTDWDPIIVALLMDIRDRLDVTNRKLSALECPRFLGIPNVLTRIARNTAKPKRKRKASHV